MSALTFVAYGIPQPQGSTKAFARMGKDKRTGITRAFASVTSDNPKNKDWRSVVAFEANTQLHKQKFLILDGPATLKVAFYLPRPKSIKAKPVPHLKKPDIDKLLRSVTDALTGIAWVDDSQVVAVQMTKQYAAPGEQPRVCVTVFDPTDNADGYQGEA